MPLPAIWTSTYAAVGKSTECKPSYIIAYYRQFCHVLVSYLTHGSIILPYKFVVSNINNQVMNILVLARMYVYDL